MHKTFMDEDEGFFLENHKYSTIFRKIIPIKEKLYWVMIISEESCIVNN